MIKLFIEENSKLYSMYEIENRIDIYMKILNKLDWIESVCCWVVLFFFKGKIKLIF